METPSLVIIISLDFQPRSCSSRFGGTESIQFNRCNQHIILHMKMKTFCLMLCYLSNHLALSRTHGKMGNFPEEAVSGDNMTLVKGRVF